MRFSNLALYFLAALVATTPSDAVLYGDEQYGDIIGGRFWAFNSRGVSIVNPETCKVEKTISSDSEGNLPNSWYDGVYMEHCLPRSNLAERRHLLHSPSEVDNGDCKQYVIINSAVTVSDTHGEDAGSGEVIIFDVEKQEVASRVLVGPRPVHSYGVYTRDQYWTHSDGDGFFYIIDLEDIEKHSGKPIKVKVDAANHGKLLWDESESLQNTGYATSTGEPHLFIVDMETEEQIGTFNFTGQAGCFGSHSIAYAKTNKHLYIECTGFGGLLEIDVSSPRSPTLVKQHMGLTGSLYESPDEAFVVVTDKGGNKLTLMKPSGSGIESSVAYSINIDRHPTSPIFFPLEEADAGTVDYNMCLSLTVNTNINHYDDSGNLACDYYSCSQAQTPGDVDSGVCVYETDEAGEPTRDLLEVNVAQIDLVFSGVAPFAGISCERCKNLNNYDEEDGMCTCTPDCGSCAEVFEGDEHFELSGATCLNLQELIDGTANPTFVKAGGVKQGLPYPYSPQCGFGRTYRPHKRGGYWDAMPTDFPNPSVSLVDMKTFELKCNVELPGNPFRIIYVPPSENIQETSSELSAGAIAGIAVGGLAGALIVTLMLTLALRKTNMGNNEYSNGTTDYAMKADEGNAIL